MLEPSDLQAAVNRLLIGLGQIVTAAVTLAIVARLGHHWASLLAVASLGTTTVSYALQVNARGALQITAAIVAVRISWLAGITAALAFLVGW